ncbi:hypothetical protein [Lactobacillus sp. wkB10]|uniref:hypothetical protein n=1 Tax=Lactobacillus sp. wkB10 TaxID=1545701 RepID=UPI0005134846|nr:hypothetical protein [Lactobacillus sp. wkB10]KGG54215.1 hypothetical protein LACWKB10_1136 [Lactobacillus sp. wkB10]
MVMFNHLFGRFFKRKVKIVHLIVVLQFISSLASAFFTYFSFYSGRFHLNLNNNLEFFPGWMALFASFTFLFGPILYILTVVQNERLNRSQTWRLAPISDGKFYAANILSSFVSLIYFVFLDLLIAIAFFLLSLIIYPQLGKNLRFELNLDTDTFLTFICIILLVILTSLFIYFLVSFLNFSSQAILSFLPQASSHILISFIRIFIIIILMGLLVKLYRVLINSFVNLFLLKATDLAGLEYVVGMMFVANLIMLGINVFLINHFFEAEEK